MPSETIPTKVVVKCRSLLESEKNKGVKNVAKCSGQALVVNAGGKEQSFSFDQAYTEGIKSKQIYEECCESLLQRALNGYNVTFMTFGSVDSGKSFLLSGSNEDPGIVPCLNRRLFEHIESTGNKDYFVTVTFVEVEGDELQDLLNPHTNEMMIREHQQLGIYIDGLSELVIKNENDLTRFYVQGNRARKMGATDLKAHKTRSSGIFTINIEQKDNVGSKVAIKSKIAVVDLAGTEFTGKDTNNKGVNAVANVLTCLKKGGQVPFRDAKITRLLQDSLGGNAATLILLCVSPSDKLYQETLQAAQVAAASRGIKSKVKINLDEGENLINELRDEIASLRAKIIKNPDNKEDVLKMEDLIKDLQLAKKQGRDEKEKRSLQYEEERRTNLTNKGILEWVMESNSKDNKEVQEKIIELQKEKDHLTLEYREKRKKVDDTKEDLQKKISEYSKLAQSGKVKESETKKRVTAIHELKEQLRQDTDALRDIKQKLKDAQDQQRNEKEHATGQTLAKGSAEFRQMVESEERRRMEKENKAMIAEEVERAKLECEQEKAEIQMRASKGGAYSSEEGMRLEMEAVDAKSERAVITLQLQALQQEKDLALKHLEDLYSRQKEDLEIQQLQHFQTFRQYREVFEQQKAVLEQRYRTLLEDAIQDAVFLSSRNGELEAENNQLKQKIAELKDGISLGAGSKDTKGRKDKMK